MTVQNKCSSGSAGFGILQLQSLYKLNMWLCGVFKGIKRHIFHLLYNLLELLECALSCLVQETHTHSFYTTTHLIGYAKER